MLEDEVRERLWGDPNFFYERNYRAHRESKSAIYSGALAARLADFDAVREPLVDTSKLGNRHPLHKRSYVDFKLRLADHLLSDHGDPGVLRQSVPGLRPPIHFST